MAGKRFVVTGVFDRVSREEIERFIDLTGGRVTCSVSAVTNYLIAGNRLEDGRAVETSCKHRKASAMRVPILNLTEFERLITRLTGL